jgi:tripartite-type tricarboxylate transporter receptor subunit TctC
MTRPRQDGPTRFLLGLLTVAGVSLLAPGPAWSQSVANFFKGKDLQILVGYSAGGGYDIYARTVARYLGKYIPGNPTIIVQNMPGADGLKLANYVYVQAPKDGTVIALTNRNLAVAPMLGLVDSESMAYDPQKLYWIANLNSEVSVAVFRSDAGVASVDDLKGKPLIVGSTGLTSNNAVYPYVMNNLIGTQLKVIIGYRGTNDVTLALERGEIQGVGGWAWSSIMAQRPYWIRDKTIVPLLQLSTQKIPELVGVPSILDYAKTDETRQALELIFSPDILGRPFFAPPGISAETGRMLRTAFNQMSKDPSFLAATETAKLNLSYTDGETLDQFVDRMTRATPAAIALARKLTQRGATAVGSRGP